MQDHLINLGVALQKLGQFNLAAEAYSRAAMLKPDSAQVLLDLGVVHQKLGDLKAAGILSDEEEHHNAFKTLLEKD